MAVLSTETLVRLKGQLLTSGLQQKNSSLYQVIDQLIGELLNLNQAIFGKSWTSGVIPSGPPAISNSTFITAANETGTLPNSRQLVAGDNVTIDTSVAGQEIVSASVTQTTIIQTNQPLILKVIDIEIPYNYRSGKVTVLDTFTESQVDGPVFITQVPNDESEVEFIVFIGRIIDNQTMEIFWQAPFGAPRSVTVNCLIGAE